MDPHRYVLPDAVRRAAASGQQLLEYIWKHPVDSRWGSQSCWGDGGSNIVGGWGVGEREQRVLYTLLYPCISYCALVSPTVLLFPHRIPCPPARLLYHSSVSLFVRQQPQL